MAKTGKAFLDRVVARAKEMRPKPQGFFHRLPADVQTELLELRRRLRAGEFPGGALPLARSIVEECRQDGIPICGNQGVRMWLAKPD
jgi:hypothetical protein